MRSGTGSAKSPCTGPIYHNKHTKETHLGFGERFGFDLIAQKSEMIVHPSIRLSASISPVPVQWVVHGTINCKQTPPFVLTTTWTRTPSRVSSLDAPPMGFGFTASAKGVRQCRVESSRETESESGSGWAPLKLDAICVQLGYANLPEPCQRTASPAST